MIKIIKNIVYSFKELLAPTYCLVCNSLKISSDRNESKYICQPCLAALPLAAGSASLTGELRSTFSGDDLALSNICCMFSISEDSAYMELIYGLKYKGLTRLAVELGYMLGRRLQLEGMTEYNAIVPVPIHRARRRERGYNQSEYIAQGVVASLSLPLHSDLVIRSRYTQTQTQLESAGRKSNVSGAFKALNNNGLNNAKVLIIDDVLTTGSTLNECGMALLEAGFRQVDAATLAKA